MPLVPEKLNSRQEVRNAISSQFWDQPVHSARSLDGTARTLACEPPSVGQTAASGLLRSQELLATQAAGLPLIPGFCKHHGGVVLDRVITKVGGRRWWANLSGRAKAQQMWAAHQTGAKVGDALKDLNSYSLSARGRYALGRNASLNYVIEAPNAQDLKTEIQGTSSGATRRGRRAGAKAAFKSQAWAKYQLPGHDLVGSTAWNQEYLDSAATYCAVPMAMSLDLASKDRPDGIQYRVGLHQVSAPEVEGTQIGTTDAASSSSTLTAGQWRSSLHVQGAVAVEGEAHLWRPGRRGSNPPAPVSPALPAEARQAACQDASASQQAALQKYHESPAAGQSDQVQQHGLSQRSTQAADSSSPSVGPVAAAAPVSSPVHQAANTGQSEQQPQAGSPSRSASSSTFHAEPVAERMQPHSQSRSAPSGVPTHPVIPAGHPEAQRQAAASEMGSPCHSTSQQPGESALHQQSPTTGLPRTSGQGSNHGAVPSAAAASQDNTMQRQGHSPTAVLPSTSQLQGSMTRPQARRAWPVVNRRRGQESNGVLVDNYSAVVSDSDTSEEEEEAQQPVHLLGNLNAKTIQSGLSEAQSNVDKLRQVLDTVTAGLEEGRAQHQHQRQLALSRRRKPVPYSPWLSQPFLKVNAAVGCLARMPLPQAAFRPVQHHTSESLQMQRPQTRSRSSSRFGSDLWAPYLRDTALRVFGSVGVTGQLGHFCRPVLDFTAGSVRLDFGLTSPHHVNSMAAVSSYGNLSVFNPREDHLDTSEDADEPAYSQRLRFKNRAFALEGRGIWHALSASVTQQVIGPVRARADFRYALDLPSSIPQGLDGKRSWHNILEAAGKTRPTLLETVYGLDVIIPGTSGTARAALWYSPVRNEAMAEIKLF